MRALIHVVVGAVITAEFPAFSSSLAVANTPQWTVHEATLASGRSYAKPLWDVSVSVNLTSPSGRRDQVEAFWYEGHRWKFRCAPVRIGSRKGLQIKRGWTFIVFSRHMATARAACFGTLPVISFALANSGIVSTEYPIKKKSHIAIANVCAWPNLTLLPDGTIAAVLFNQPSHGQSEGDIECWASHDGIEWERRSTITRHRPNTIRMNHAAGLAGNGDLVVLCSGWTNEKQAERPKQTLFRDAVLRCWVLRSKDSGRTWEKSETFPTAEAGWTEYIPFGDIWVGQDGSLHTSCYQGQYIDATKSFKTKAWRSWHFRSDDDGWTWKPISIIGPRHNETNIFPLGGKSWLAAARIDRMELFRSDDHGANWGDAQPVTQRNEINGHLTRLKDGRLLLSYGVRVRGQRGVCAKLSDDNGQTWSEPIRLAYTVGDADCGYPSSVQLADGPVVTAWYSKQTPDHNGYHMGVTTWDVSK